ncbi:sensor histidine kinase [Clostridium sp. 1001275B_160808_H3]|uniref:sensor histidine kinase n=1 Tax=Clostridium sp. 1001275B_160808_H3 TaxID=2787110 RepID=UPI001897AF7E|nr:sensor histidine kinase [Clostridium sp. 1001275B_160808_H3]
MYKGKIRNRLLIFFLVITFLPITTLGIFANLIYTKIVEKKVNQHTEQMIKQIEVNIDNHIKSVENILMYISNSEDVINFLKESEEDSSSSEISILEDRIKKSLKVYTDVNSEIFGLLIVNNYNKYISNELEKKTRDSLIKETWYTGAINESGKVYFFSNPIGRNLRSYKSYSAEDIISISKAVIDKETNKPIGVVMADINLKKFDDIIRDNYIGEKGFFYLLDNNNNIVYSPVNSIIYRINSNNFDNKSDSFIHSINNETFKIMYTTSEVTGWKSIGVFSFEDITKDITVMERFTLIIAIATSFLAVFFSLLFTNSIVTPIRELRTLMKGVESGDLDLKFEEYKYSNEFGELGHSFNHMVSEIKKLINMVYKEQRSKRKAEMETLQAQIKPHFLYNTLDTIAWMAEDYNAKDIVELVAALTKVFRIGLNKGKEVIKLRDEIEHINSYLIIQKYRYEDKLSYEINFHNEILDTLILKLITQPIVENAIYHGIKEKRGRGKIYINFRKVADEIIITVEDNGAGITEEKLLNINSMLETSNSFCIDSESGSGYGISNVNTRIKLSYGQNYGLHYYSELGEWTKVEIRLPFKNDYKG